MVSPSYLVIIIIIGRGHACGREKTKGKLGVTQRAYSGRMCDKLVMQSNGKSE